MAADVFARLRLSGEQFSSENSRLWAEVEAGARDTSARIKNSFESSFSEVKRLAADALTAPRNAAGALDLGVGNYREAAAAAQAKATALREVAAAARAAALAEGDTSQATRLYVQAASAAAIEAEQVANGAHAQANAMDRLQTELNQTTSATQSVVRGNAVMNSSFDRVSGGVRGSRQATIQASQQFQDFFIQVQGGQAVMTAFAQQGSQLAFVMSNSGGAVGKFASFMAGPWGTAIFAATTVLGLLTNGLFENAKAAEAAKAGNDGLADAQGALGRIFDLTSGKLEHQNELLRLNARLTAINLRAEALKEGESAKGALSAVGQSDGSAIGGLVARASAGVLGLDPVDSAGQQSRLLADVRAGRITREQALKKSASMNFSGLRVDRTKFQQAIIDEASSEAKSKVADLIDQSLDDNKLAAGLRRDAKTKKPKDNSRQIASLEEFGRDAADRIANLQAPFAGQPKMIDQAAKALRSLADITDDVEERNVRLIKLTGKGLPGYDLLKQQAAGAKEAIIEGMERPYRDFVQQQEEGLAVQRLVAQGRDLEAEALSEIFRLQKQMGPLDADHRDAVIDIVKARRDEAREVDIALEKTRRYLNALDDIRGATENLFESLPDRGLKSLGDFVKNIRGAYGRLVSQEITEKLFGDVFRDLEDQITGANKTKESADIVDKALRQTAAAADVLTGSLHNLANPTAAPGVPGVSAAGGNATLTSVIAGLGSVTAQMDKAAKTVANDNSVFGGADGPDIVVTGAKIKGLDLSPEKLFNNAGKSLLGKLFGEEAGSVIGDKVGSAFKGAAVGQMTSGILNSIGIKQSKTGAQIGGAIGSVLPIPGGALIGSLVGGTFGGLFSKTKKGSATLGLVNGELGVSGITGNSASYRSNAGKLGGGVSDMLSGIADALGADLLGSISVSIGQRKKSFVVDPTGMGRTKGSGTMKFDDEQDAIEAAVRDALRDGVLRGISAASQRILNSGQDLERAVTKAGLIEAIPKQLKARLDPVGAAIDEVNEKWDKTIAALREGGASAQQMADAQKLYNLELDDAKNNTAGASAVLKDFLSGLKAGSDSPYSLRDQEATARTALQPFLDKIAAGETIDNGKYTAAAQTFLDIERQMNGSTEAYFAELDRIQAATSKAISTIDNAAPIRTVADPFVQKTATNTQATAEILSQHSGILSEILSVLRGGVGGGGGFGSGGAGGYGLLLGKAF